jgi:hypothetical protein
MLNDQDVVNKELAEITFSSTDLVIPDVRESKRQKTAERSSISWKGAFETKTPGVPTKPLGEAFSNFAPSISWSYSGRSPIILACG